MPERDLVVVGASAGGLGALHQMLAGLPPGLPANIVVVLHAPPSSPGALSALIWMGGRLPVAYAVDGQQLTRGLVTIAPPGRHLSFDHDGRLRLVRGPLMNWARPAIDPLFCSAARQFGSRVLAVVLSGALDDGASGAAAVTAAGGEVLIQDPADALFDSMPSAASALVPNAMHTSAAELGPAVAARVGRPVPETEVPNPDEQAAGEVDMSGQMLHDGCQTGHAFSPQTLAAAQALGIEEALWMATARLQDHAAIQRRLARRMEGRSQLVTIRAQESAEQSLHAAKIITERVLPVMLSAGEDREPIEESS
ncbi:MAG TPA: chemotaxis protein CheB [Kineosporiaceae bacterium]